MNVPTEFNIQRYKKHFFYNEKTDAADQAGYVIAFWKMDMKDVPRSGRLWCEKHENEKQHLTLQVDTVSMAEEKWNWFRLWAVSFVCIYYVLFVVV